MAWHQSASAGALVLAVFFFAAGFFAGVEDVSSVCTENLYLLANSDIAVFLAEIFQSYL